QKQSCAPSLDRGVDPKARAISGRCRSRKSEGRGDCRRKSVRLGRGSAQTVDYAGARLSPPMASDRERLDKVLAIAVNRGEYEEEAITALRMARELVKKNPNLAHPPPPPTPPPSRAPAGDWRHQVRITNVAPFWLNILLNSLSQGAYGLGLKSKIVVDFEERPYTIDVRCDGNKAACEAFKAHVDWLLEHINSQPRNLSR